MLALLPKKGDLSLLKNWGLVALLCSDDKILSKCMANRLKTVLEKLICHDQTMLESMGKSLSFCPLTKKKTFDHWLRAAVPVNEGGQGLIDLKSRLAASHLQAVQHLLYHNHHKWMDVACAHLNRVGRMGLDRHLFLILLKGMDFTGLASFYRTVLQMWQVFAVSRDDSDTAVFWTLEEPLIFNPSLCIAALDSLTVRSGLVGAGFCKIRHLWTGDGWLAAGQVAALVGIKSVRIVQRMLEELCTSLLSPMQDHLHNVSGTNSTNEHCFSEISVTAQLEGWQEKEGMILSFKTPKLGLF